MNSANWIVAGAAFLGAIGLSSAVRADEPTTLPAPAPKPSTTRAAASILAARDASAAIAAYSRARATFPRSVRVVQAYVRRMAELGLPDMAEAQANEVLRIEMTDPLSLAVVAAGRARRGETSEAIAAIATASRFDADDPVVRRIAGQILAWHDTRTGFMAEDTESSLELLRAAVDRSPEYTEAYNRAYDAYIGARAAAARAAAVAKQDAVPKPAVGANVIVVTKSAVVAAVPAAATAQRPVLVPPVPSATIVPDSVQAEFEEGDDDETIYTYVLTCLLPCRWSDATVSWYGGQGWGGRSRSFGGWRSTTWAPRFNHAWWRGGRVGTVRDGWRIR